MLISAENSVLLIVDIQQRLVPAIPQVDVLVAHNVWLARIAGRLAVPIIATEQYPAGLGPTLPEVAACVPPASIVDKIHFSAIPDGCLAPLPGFDRDCVVLTGMETHVCVLQTALDLLALGKKVYVVAECVGSRRPEDRALALERMRQEGCRIVSREMVAFEWLRRAGTEAFRQISREFLR